MSSKTAKYKPFTVRDVKLIRVTHIGDIIREVKIHVTVNVELL